MAIRKAHTRKIKGKIIKVKEHMVKIPDSNLGRLEVKQLRADLQEYLKELENTANRLYEETSWGDLLEDEQARWHATPGMVEDKIDKEVLSDALRSKINTFGIKELGINSFGEESSLSWKWGRFAEDGTKQTNLHLTGSLDDFEFDDEEITSKINNLRTKYKSPIQIDVSSGDTYEERKSKNVLSASWEDKTIISSERQSLVLKNSELSSEVKNEAQSLLDDIRSYLEVKAEELHEFKIDFYDSEDIQAYIWDVNTKYYAGEHY